MDELHKKIKLAIWRKDIITFLTECFPHHYNKPFSSFHKEIFKNLFKYPFIDIAAPRKHGKTEIVTFGWTMWNLICNPLRYFSVLISNNYTNACKFLTPIKEEIESNKLILDVCGCLRSDKWSESEAEFRDKSGKFKKKIIVGGNDFKIRGIKFLQFRPDLIIIDDAEDDELVKSDTRRDSFENWLIKAVEESMSIETKNNQIVFVGTILHRASQLSKLQIGEGRYRKWISLFYEAIRNSYKPNEEALWEEGKPLEELVQIRQDDPYKFAQEYMNNPVPYEHAMFKEEYFDNYQDDQIPKNLKVNITVDLACTDKSYSDYTVILPCGVDEYGDLWVLPYKRGRYIDPDEIINLIFGMYLKYQKNFGRLGIEKNSFQRFLIKNFDRERKKRGLRFPVYEIQSKGDKVQKIAQLQPMFASGDIHVSWFMNDLKQELLDFPRAMHDDISDALAMQLEFVNRKPAMVKKQVDTKWHPPTPEAQRNKILDRFKKVKVLNIA